MGKTTLLERLVPELSSRGLVVSLIKHSHKNIDIDRPGKDSYRLREVGLQGGAAARQRPLGADARAARRRRAAAGLPARPPAALRPGADRGLQARRLPEAGGLACRGRQAHAVARLAGHRGDRLRRHAPSRCRPRHRPRRRGCSTWPTPQRSSTSCSSARRRSEYPGPQPAADKIDAIRSRIDARSWRPPVCARHHRRHAAAAAPLFALGHGRRWSAGCALHRLPPPASAVVAAASDLKFALDEIAARFEADTRPAACARLRLLGQLLSPDRAGRAVRAVPVGRRGLRASSSPSRAGRSTAARSTRIGRIVLFAPTARRCSADAQLADLRQALADGRLHAVRHRQSRARALWPRGAGRRCSAPGLWDAIEPKLVLGENVSQAAQFATSRLGAGRHLRAVAGAGAGGGEAGQLRADPEALAPAAAPAHGADAPGAAPTARAFYDYLQQPARARDPARATASCCRARAERPRWTGTHCSCRCSWPLATALVLLPLGVLAGALAGASRASAASAGRGRWWRCRWCCRPPCSATTCWCRWAAPRRSGALVRAPDRPARWSSPSRACCWPR